MPSGLCHQVKRDPFPVQIHIQDSDADSLVQFQLLSVHPRDVYKTVFMDSDVHESPETLAQPASRGTLKIFFAK